MFFTYFMCFSFPLLSPFMHHTMQVLDAPGSDVKHLCLVTIVTHVTCHAVVAMSLCQFDALVGGTSRQWGRQTVVGQEDSGTGRQQWDCQVDSVTGRQWWDMVVQADGGGTGRQWWVKKTVGQEDSSGTVR